MVEGGPTITQVVREEHPRHPRADPAAQAGRGRPWRLERADAKAAILEAYRSAVCFGQGAYGVPAPAKALFSTSADRLTCPGGAAGREDPGPVAHDPGAPWFVGWVDQLLGPADHRTRSGPAGGPDGQGAHRGLRIATTVDVAGRRGGDLYGALVAVEPGTGAVRSTVGGRSRDGPGRRRGGRRPGPARGGRPRR